MFLCVQNTNIVLYTIRSSIICNFTPVCLLTFRRNVLLPRAGSMRKRNKKGARSQRHAELWVLTALCWLFAWHNRQISRWKQHVRLKE
jgi:hypothetical protein